MKKIFFVGAIIVFSVFIIFGLRETIDTFSFLQKIFSSKFFISQIAPGANESVFNLSPSTGAYVFNNTFNVDLTINTSANITSVMAYLNFPSSMLNVVSIDTSSGVFGNVWENTYNNTTGRIQLQASTPTPGFLGSSGLIARITFRAAGAGTASVTYDSSSLALKPDDSNILNLTNSTGGSFTVTVDTTPPTRSGALPSGTLTSGTTQTTISLGTNENATCKYGTTAGMSYASLPSTFSTTGGTSHSQLITGLSNGSSYTYYVRCQDAAGNPNTTDYPVTFSVALPACTDFGLSTPVITPTIPQTNQSFTITCPANSTGIDCVNASADGAACSFSSWSGNNAIFNCSGLSAGSHTARCYSQTGTSRNCCSSERTATFSVQTPTDTTPPTRSGALPSGTLTSGTTQTTISLSTNESATCKYGTTANTSYASLPNTFSTTGGTSHSQLITGLSNGSSYTYYVRCQDAAGNPNITDYPITFSVALSQFTVSSVSPLYLFKDKTNNLAISGNNFNISTNFYLRFMSGATAVTSLTTQPQTNSSFNTIVTVSQLASLAIGFYDLRIERSTDSQSQTYSQKILITISGDISGPTPGVRDGKVDIYDLSRMMSNWGSTNPADLAECDINPGTGNVSLGKIDIYDANKMMANWLP